MNIIINNEVSLDGIEYILSEQIDLVALGEIANKYNLSSRQSYGMFVEIKSIVKQTLITKAEHDLLLAVDKRFEEMFK